MINVASLQLQISFTERIYFVVTAACFHDVSNYIEFSVYEYRQFRLSQI